MDIGHNEGALPQPGPTLRRPSSGKPELKFHHARLVEGQTWNTGTADKLAKSAQVYLDFGRGKSVGSGIAGALAAKSATACLRRAPSVCDAVTAAVAAMVNARQPRKPKPLTTGASWVEGGGTTGGGRGGLRAGA